MNEIKLTNSGFVCLSTVTSGLVESNSLSKMWNYHYLACELATTATELHG